MNARLCLRFPVIILTLLLALGVVSRAHAQTTGNITLLNDAYAMLAQTRHDYQGHRDKAMEQIKLCLRELKATARSEVKKREPQGTSDAQLGAALKLLKQARDGLTGIPLKHVNNAIEQLNLALAIR